MINICLTLNSYYMNDFVLKISPFYLYEFLSNDVQKHVNKLSFQ